MVVTVSNLHEEPVTFTSDWYIVFSWDYKPEKNTISVNKYSRSTKYSIYRELCSQTDILYA